MPGSGLGEASGLAVIARGEREVLDAASCLPGRVLILTGRAITRRTMPVVVKGAHMATFASLVVISDELRDLGHMGDSGVPVPVVFVSCEADKFWMDRAMRVTVSVTRKTLDPIIDVRLERPEQRRRRQPLGSAPSVPGTVRH